ncbi:hypothetical protein AS156_15150 [Bradyrhizobium macuxiense]|uniref:Transmembrane protein n=1 Tax=Bradyrhizobium macuxiense TaxID=1755647 RepID=A0A109JJ39_9BRAD|nr:hypothetical protein [Bradyrhizobium macuxiense]KWV49863.1 hypothetical protein AS156_15150 [Bradyrhizobium macuxiense]
MEIKSTSVLPSRYDDFLYAVICEDGNGTQISVVSALARLDVDPWEEAARLDEMIGARAQKRLISMLDRMSGQNWMDDQKKAVASRLVGLLPTSRARSNPMPGSEVSIELLVCVAIFWGFLLATAALTYNDHKTSAVAESHASITPPVQNPSASSDVRIATD